MPRGERCSRPICPSTSPPPIGLACPRRRRRCTAEAAAEADIAEAGASRPSPRVDGLVRSLSQEASGRRTSDDPPPLDAKCYPDPHVPMPLEPSALRRRGPARPIRRHSSPAERSPSRALDGSWIFRRTDVGGSPDYRRASYGGRGRTRSGSCGDDAPRRGHCRPDACLRGRTNGGPYSRSRRGRQRRAGRLDSKMREIHDDWGCVVGIGGSRRLNCSGCHESESK